MALARLDHLEEVLASLGARDRRPKFIYTIPTVQNPTGTVMPVERRRGLLEVARRHGNLATVVRGSL